MKYIRVTNDWLIRTKAWFCIENQNYNQFRFVSPETVDWISYSGSLNRVSRITNPDFITMPKVVKAVEYYKVSCKLRDLL